MKPQLRRFAFPNGFEHAQNNEGVMRGPGVHVSLSTFRDPDEAQGACTRIKSLMFCFCLLHIELRDALWSQMNINIS